MNIKFIFPGRPMRPLEVRSKNHLIPSETLCALAAVTPREHSIEIADENVTPLRLDDHPDIVAITVYTFLAPRAYEIADHYRKKGVFVALGGLHVTGLPEEAALHSDAVFVGESDESWPQFLNDFKNGQAKELYTQSCSTDIYTIPVPSRQFLDKKKYLSTASVSATRGCPYKCSYCFNSVNRNYSVFRKREVADVIAEIKTHKSNGNRYIVFFDDNLMVDKAYGRQLCFELEKLNIRWRCASSIDIAYDEETVKLMAEAGCESVFIGFESINADSLADGFKFQNKAADYLKLINVFHKYGIMINASFVFGFDHDDLQVFERTAQFGIEAKLASINFHILTPYPGTPFYDKIKNEGRIFETDWSKFDTAHAVFTPKNMTAQQLEKGYRKAYELFYCWSSIFKRMPQGISSKPRFLSFNFFLKKANPLWGIIMKLNLLSPAFKLYHAIDYRLWKIGRHHMKEKNVSVISLRKSNTQ